MLYLNRAQGWDVLAGQDVAKKKFTQRYLLTANNRLKKYAILTTTDRAPTDWKLLLEGNSVTVNKEWDAIDQNPIL